MTELPSAPRPRAVTVAFWCWMVAAVLLIVGGLLTATVDVALPPVFRGCGVIVAVAGAGLAFAAGRTRSGDRRFGRAAVALSLAVVVVITLIVLFGVTHLLTLLALLPLIAGTVSIRSTAAQTWFDGEGGQ
jgi:peptidoglycan/LPS O-acetylase OafA/YrhL